jgi:SWIM zinc finger.
MKTITLPRDSQYGASFGILTTNNKTYVIPGWHEVPVGTTRDQIKFKTEPKRKPLGVLTYNVPSSSNPNSTYTVTYKNKKWSCTCPANQFRRQECKHINKIRTSVQST